MIKFLQECLSFFLPAREGHSVQWAVFLGAIAVVTAIVAPPMLDKAAKTYADNRAFGIDQVITSSIEKKKRYTVRKSVLDDQ